MPEELNERERLVKELSTTLMVDIADIISRRGDLHVELLADWIIADRKKVLEDIRKPLMAWKNRDTTEGKRWGGEIPEIDEALAIIEKEGL